MGCTISVIIPMYNTEKYIDMCIKSLINQTYEDFEVIIIDDGSTDKSIEIVESYVQRDERFILLKQNNKGPSAARNQGIKLAKGKFIYFMDSDDLLDPQTFEICVEELPKNNVDQVIFDAQCLYDEDYLIDSNQPIVGESFYDRSNVYFNNNPMSIQDFLKTVFLVNKFRGNSYFYMTKRETFINKVWFNENINFYEDVLFYYQLSEHIDQIKYIARRLYIRRFRKNSLMTNDDNTLKKLRDILSCVNIIENMDKNTVKNRQIKKFTINYLLNQAYNTWIKLPYQNNAILDPFIKLRFTTCKKYSDCRRFFEGKYNDNLLTINELISS